MSKKQVTVFGATGAQGGSVARELAKDGNWKVVAVTRDPEGEKAKQLQKNTGAQLCKADLDQPKEVAACVKGSFAVFGNTDFWATMNKEKEIQQGKNIVDASKKEGVQHLVMSTLENASAISGGKRHVEHFDSKAEIEEYVKKSNVPYTFVQPACFYENLKGMVKPGPSGQLEFTLPIPGDSKFAQYSVDETGTPVKTVLNNRDRYLGKKLALVGDVLSPNEMAAILSKQFGKPVKFNSVPEKAFAGFPFPGAAELSNMFNYFHEYGYYGEKKNKRAGGLSSFSQWAAKWKRD